MQSEKKSYLVVIHDFGNYRRGEKIIDEKEIDEILGGENAKCCNLVVDADA